MTDTPLLAAARWLIEAGYEWNEADSVVLDDQTRPIYQALTHLRAFDPGGQRLLRAIETGLAMGRLEAMPLRQRFWKAERDADAGVCVYVRERDDWLDGCGDSLPAAIAAALGEEP